MTDELQPLATIKIETKNYTAEMRVVRNFGISGVEEIVCELVRIDKTYLHRHAGAFVLSDELDNADVLDALTVGVTMLRKQVTR